MRKRQLASSLRPRVFEHRYRVTVVGVTQARERTSEEIVNRAVDVFLANPGGDQRALLSALEAAGLSPTHAWLAYQFVPMAFCRIALRHSGVGFPTVFLSRDPDTGAETSQEFAAQPIYTAAVKVADERIAGGLVQQRLMPIVGHSAEFTAINQLARGGSKLSDVRLVEPVLFAYRAR
jgi:hypothetical protein